ncbi:MAG: KEOPS complex kinase/ATPase Bud32 [Candidatus Freyarchaeota archaeon]|nr:KEOPS complex kinase/ATPase Bud32 [Candidatus Freyrarchaeum guaymaensis]
MLFRKGAEAHLFLEDLFGRKVLVKVRVTKNYRVTELDLLLRRQRTVREARLLHAAKRAGVPAPTVYLVDVDNATIIMDYVEGGTLKELIKSGRLPGEELRKRLYEVGKSIGRLHRMGVIHGDLTTSNMILSRGKIFFIDFGLGDFSRSVEDRGVDLHLMKRALESTHYDVFEEAFGIILQGYRSSFSGADAVIEKMWEIERRGRYSER